MTRLLPTTLVTVILATTAAHAASFDCKTPLTLGSEKFDLSSLTGAHTFEDSTPTPPTVTKVAYHLSLCSPLPVGSESSEDTCPTGTNICMITSTSRTGLEDRVISVVPISQLKENDVPTTKLLEGEKGVEKGWVLEVGGGEYNGVKQSAEIEMVCDEKGTETVPTVKEYDPKAGVLSLRWLSAAACSTNSGDHPPPPPGDDKDPPKKDDPTESSGMGFFGWFFTLFFLSLIAYFAIGTWHNYTQYGATGLDAIPHRDMWQDLPYVVSDLFKGRGGSRSGYSALG